MPLYVPKFRNGWEPPLDVLQEAPWEVEGLASVPSDQVRTPAPAQPMSTPPQAHLSIPPGLPPSRPLKQQYSLPQPLKCQATLAHLGI